MRPLGEKYLVLEGTRKIAALKSLASDHDAGVELPERIHATLKAVPVTSVSDLDDDPALPLSLMGIRHVGGIKEWGGYQRAKLVTELRDTFNLDPGEVAARLGMTAHEVNRRYRAFKALQQMMEDDEYGDVAKPDMYPLFREAVAGTVIKEWLAWDDEKGVFQSEDTLHLFYGLITPTEEDEGPTQPAKIITREAVRDLRDILPLPEARRSLLEPDTSFADALAIAKADSLARSWVTQVAEAVTALKWLIANEGVVGV